MFGGRSVAARHALFEIGESGLATIADLFSDDRYFADTDAFWTAQNAAIEARRAAYLEAGWADAIVVAPSDPFSTWEYEKAGKRKGGRVYLDVRASGEVTIHEGYISRKEAARIAKGEEAGAGRIPARLELTSTMQTYIDLHCHAAVRATLTGHPGVALRLMVAHAIVGSHLWTVRPDPQRTGNADIRDSLDNSPSEAEFDARRRAVLAVLDMADDEPTVTGGNGDDYGVVGLFHRLLDLPDAVVMEVITIVMGETLAVGSATVAALGMEIGVDMARVWHADPVFFDLLRDKEVLGRIVAEVAGEPIADANVGEKGKTLKAIIRDHLDGTNGRARHAPWVPRWMTFPPAAYTTRGGVGTVEAHAKALAARDIARPEAGRDAPDIAAPDAVAVLPDPDAGTDRLAA